MPQVPYQPFSTVQPTSPGERVAVSTPGAAFGENIGAALSHLGTTVDQVGNEMFSRAMGLQQLNNENEARDLQMRHAEQTAPLVAAFDAREGKDKVDNLIPHLNALKDLRNEIANSASNPMVRRMFLNDVSPFAQREIFSAAKEAGTANKNYTLGEAKGQLRSIDHRFVDPEDQGEVDSKIALKEKAIDTIIGVTGGGPQAHEALLQDEKSNTYTSQVMEMATRGNIPGAWDKFQGYMDQGLIDVKQHDAIQKHIWHENEATGAKNIVKQIYSVDKSNEQMQAELDRAADDPKNSLNDPNYKTALQNQLTHLTAFVKRQIIDERNQNDQAIYKGIQADRFSDKQGMLADPEAGPAYRALPASKQNQWDKDVSVKADRRDFETNENNYHVLYGMAHDPAQRQAFLEANLYNKDYKLSDTHTKELVGLRDRLIKEPIDDPHVNQGMRNLFQNYSPQLRDLGLINKDTGLVKKGKDLDALRGGLAIALHAFEGANNRPPTPEEFDTQIAQPLIKTHSEPAWFGMSTQKVGEFKRTFPPKVVNDARKELTIPGQDPPTDAQLNRYITQQMWKEHFQGSAGGEGGGPAPQSK